MENTRNDMPIGVFDSGVGGISVLAELIKTISHERFIYLGDCLNAPYGTKDVLEARRLTLQAADFLVNKGIKALVVACNTATSAAIVQLRQKLDIPVIGMEPALKPAVERGGSGSIVVMATPMTLKEQKFQKLMERYKDNADIIPLPCPGLVELIEQGKLEGEEITSLLKKLVSSLGSRKISSVVLGCTHYPLIKEQIQGVYGEHVEIIDGNKGTALHLKRVLERERLLAPREGVNPDVTFYTFGDERKVIPLCKHLLRAMLRNRTPLIK